MRRLLKRLILWALADGVVVDEPLAYDAVDLDIPTLLPDGSPRN